MLRARIGERDVVAELRDRGTSETLILDIGIRTVRRDQARVPRSNLGDGQVARELARVRRTSSSSGCREEREGCSCAEDDDGSGPDDRPRPPLLESFSLSVLLHSLKLLAGAPVSPFAPQKPGDQRRLLVQRIAPWSRDRPTPVSCAAGRMDPGLWTRAYGQSPARQCRNILLICERLRQRRPQSGQSGITSSCRWRIPSWRGTLPTFLEEWAVRGARSLNRARAPCASADVVGSRGAAGAPESSGAAVRVVRPPPRPGEKAREDPGGRSDGRRGRRLELGGSPLTAFRDGQFIGSSGEASTGRCVLPGGRRPPRRPANPRHELSRRRGSELGWLTVSRPVGGILSSSRRSLGGHPSERPTWGAPSLEDRASNPSPTLGLAPGGVYRATEVTLGAGALLPHPFTLTCAGPEARHRRFPFCGTVLRVTPTGR